MHLVDAMEAVLAGSGHGVGRAATDTSPLGGGSGRESMTL
jgi:hypothetical protein